MDDKEIDLTVSPRWTDEQVLRARLAALETAHMVHGFVADGYVKGLLDIAESFEAWLLRSAPIDVSTANGGVRHDGETVAEPVGYRRCDTTWRTEDGARHLCIYPPNHEDFPRVEHRCSCGDVLDASTTTD